MAAEPVRLILGALAAARAERRLVSFGELVRETNMGASALAHEVRALEADRCVDVGRWLPIAADGIERVPADMRLTTAGYGLWLSTSSSQGGGA